MIILDTKIINGKILLNDNCSVKAVITSPDVLVRDVLIQLLHNLKGLCFET